MKLNTSGLWITTTSDAAVAAIEAFEAELLCYGDGAGVIFSAADADPDAPAAHALAAAAHLFALSPAGVTAAARHIEAAGRLASYADARERLLIRAIMHWGQGKVAASLVALEQLLDSWPRDLVAAKIAVFHCLNLGELETMARLTAAVLAANPDRPEVMGIHAFALEQTGRSSEAEALGRRGVAAGFDPWAQHAVAHALESQGRIEAGSAWLAAHAPGWERCSSFMFTHNWWHAALFRLALGDRAGALDIFDRRVWSRRKDYAQDQINAVSLLARLDLHGVEVESRWREVADHLAARTSEHLNPLFDLHLVYGLARAGRDAEVAQMLGSLALHARTADPIWGQIARPAALAVVAHARGEHQKAQEGLADLLPRLVKVGGSHTQRDLFELLWLDATVRSGSRQAREASTGAAGGDSAIQRRWRAKLDAPPSELLPC